MTTRLYLNIAISVFIFLQTLIVFGQEVESSNIKFLQAENTYVITKNNDSISLERKPFSIRYFGKQYNGQDGKFYAAKIAVIENPSDLTKLKVGQKLKNIPFFEPGTGLASGENGRYDTIFITNKGHHYLIYENEIEKRVDLVSKNEHILELEWKISAAFFQEKNVQFTELSLASLYFVVFIDKNLNGKINKDELKIVKVNFKEN